MASEVGRSRAVSLDEATLAHAKRIVDDVRARGDVGVREWGERLGDVAVGVPLVLGREELRRAFEGLPREQRELLERTAERIRAFAQSQRACLSELDVAVPGGRAGHTVAAVRVAGCYAPGGRFPLPSSVLMTAVTARAAGVERVIVASPKAAAVTVAAAFVAGADELLAVGGAQAVAAMAYGTQTVARCDVIVGPGNKWVTAAKKLVFGDVGIDMLAGPSELLVLCDDTADAGLVAADLLAQAEHDEDAVPGLVTTSEDVVRAVEDEIETRLSTLPTAATARAAMRNGYAVVVGSVEEGVRVSDEIAPEHLEIMVRDSESVARACRNYGAVFLGSRSAEIFGDYGVGPNHVLPTSGTARFCGGLSVLHFLRVRTWLRMEEGDAARGVAQDAAVLARLEGLEGHARAAEVREMRFGRPGT